jgi:hypothetical protein
LLQTFQIVTQLRDVAHRWGCLLALHDDRLLLTIEEQNVETRPVIEYFFSNFGVWVREKSIFKMMRICGNVVG